MALPPLSLFGETQNQNHSDFPGELPFSPMLQADLFSLANRNGNEDTRSKKTYYRRDRSQENNFDLNFHPICTTYL
jgi:hypothetical protein